MDRLCPSVAHLAAYALSLGICTVTCKSKWPLHNSNHSELGINTALTSSSTIDAEECSGGKLFVPWPITSTDERSGGGGGSSGGGRPAKGGSKRRGFLAFGGPPSGGSSDGTRGGIVLDGGAEDADKKGRIEGPIEGINCFWSGCRPRSRSDCSC